MKQIKKQNGDPFLKRKVVSVQNIDVKGEIFVTKYYIGLPMFLIQ